MLKKLMIFLCCLVLISGCSLFDKEKDEPIELTAKEVLEKLQDPKQNSFLLYLTTDNCYSCQEYQKVIDELEGEQPFEIYYLNIDVNEEDKDIKKALEELKITTGDYYNLPMTYYFYQGSLLPENIKDGYMEKKDLKKWLKNLHILH